MKSLYFSNNLFHKTLLDNIKKSKSLIYLETYILSDGHYVEDILDACILKSKEGVKVVITVDEFGFNNTKLRDKIKKTNVVLIFRKKFNISNFLQKKLLLFNKRNHKKIYIVDSFFYLGSLNLSEKHFDKKLNYKDVMILNKFNYSNALRKINSSQSSNEIPKIIYQLIENDNIDILLSKFDHSKHREKLYTFVKNAKKNIAFCSPYYNLNKKMLKYLVAAKNRGVQIKVYVPCKTDYKSYDSFMRHFFNKKSTQSILEVNYVNVFLHRKIYCFDDITLIGSQNMNYRSLFYDEEIMLTNNNNKALNLEMEKMMNSLDVVKENTKPSRIDSLAYYFLKRLRWFF